MRMRTRSELRVLWTMRKNFKLPGCSCLGKADLFGWDQSKTGKPRRMFGWSEKFTFVIAEVRSARLIHLSCELVEYLFRQDEGDDSTDPEGDGESNNKVFEHSYSPPFFQGHPTGVGP